MGINFPTAPTEGYTIWQNNGDPTFVYKSGVWTKAAGTALPTNLFVNPAFNISQQNGLTFGQNVQGLTLADQLFVYYTFTGAGQYSAYRHNVYPTPGGSPHRLQISCTTADPVVDGPDWLVFQHHLEGSRMAALDYGSGRSPKWSVVRFGWKSPAGTYCFGIKNPGGTESIACPFTITPEQANTDTLQVICIPPNSWETWPKDNSFWGYAIWSLVNGNTTQWEDEWIDGNQVSSNSMTNTFMKTVGNAAYLFDIGWYVDPNITGIPPEFVVPNYEDDLEECQRYWYKQFVLRGPIAHGSAGYAQGVHPTPMRVNPSMSIIGSPKLSDLSVTPTITGISMLNTTQTQVYCALHCDAGGFAVGRPAMQWVQGQEANAIVMNARM